DSLHFTPYLVKKNRLSNSKNEQKIDVIKPLVKKNRLINSKNEQKIDVIKSLRDKNKGLENAIKKLKNSKNEQKIDVIKSLRDTNKSLENEIKKLKNSKNEQKIDVIKSLRDKNKGLENEIKKLKNEVKRLHKEITKNQKKSLLSYGVSNVKIRKEFENEISKILKNKGIPCNVVSGSGDNGIDIFASYKGKLILIQCKCQESPLGSDVIVKMHSSVTRFDGSYGIIVYDSRKLVNNDSSLTVNASCYLKGSNSNDLIESLKKLPKLLYLDLSGTKGLKCIHIIRLLSPNIKLKELNISN
ncbi:6052_t:CDS:2, partial [Racocetra fulgida]